MSPVLALVLSFAVTAAVDPTSARARARRHEEALVAGELALAAGDASAALAAALTIDETDRRLDVRRLRWLRGRARLGVGDADAARVDLAALLADPPADANAVDAIRRVTADAHRIVGDFDACADALAGVVSATDDDRVARATCLRGTARKAMAHDVLAPGTSPAVRRLRLQLWLEDGAPREARRDALVLVDTGGAAEVLAWARAFRGAGDEVTASVLIDGLLARDEVDDDVALAAARLRAVGGGRAQVQRAGLADPSLAEAHREAGDLRGAWRASPNLDGAARWRQRAALLVDEGAWERLWGLWPRLQAHGLGHDDEVAYAVAFAAFSTDRLVEAEEVLDRITGQATFARATELRAEIKTRKTRQACRASRVGSEDPCIR